MKIELPKYPAYKRSGVEWIGEIPEGWHVRRLKMATKKITTGSTPGDELFDDDSEVAWYSPGDFQGSLTLNSSKKKLRVDAFSRGVRRFPAKSVLIVGIGATLGKVGYAPTESSGNQQINCVVTNEVAQGMFIVLYLSVIPEVMKLLANTATLGIMNQAKTGEIPLPIPSPGEQKSILAFLDRETAKINRLMAVRRKQVDRLQEQRTAVIHHAVTKGLNPQAKMKPSGVEWLGDIPASWWIYRLKFTARIKNGQDYKLVESESGYPVMGSGGQFAYANTYLHDGESVLFGRKGTINKPLYMNEKFWTVDTMFYTQIKPVITPKFLYYCAVGFPFEYYSTQTALPSMTQQDIGNHALAIPALNEQRQIVDYIETETAKLDTLIAKYQCELELLTEYRASLISHAVTGKIDVRGLV